MTLGGFPIELYEGKDDIVQLAIERPHLYSMYQELAPPNNPEGRTSGSVCLAYSERAEEVGIILKVFTEGEPSLEESLVVCLLDVPADRSDEVIGTLGSFMSKYGPSSIHRIANGDIDQIWSKQQAN